MIALIPYPGDNDEVSERNLSRAALCCDFTVSAYSRPAFRQHMLCHDAFAPDCAAKYLYAGSPAQAFLIKVQGSSFICLRPVFSEWVTTFLRLPNSIFSFIKFGLFLIYPDT